MTKTRQLTRRSLLHRGTWALALASAATGLPAWFLLDPSRAHANAECQPGARSDLTPQFLILSTSQAGDPLNTNCPGAYVAGATNNPLSGYRYEGETLDMTPTQIALGGRAWQAARPWGNLSPGLLERTCFFHHQSHTVAHSEFMRLLGFHGAVRDAEGRGSEVLPTALAEELQGPLGTLLGQPLSLGPERMTQGGQPLANTSPEALLSLFSGSTTELEGLAQLRASALDAIYADVRATGSTSHRTFLDQHVTSAQEAEQIGGELLGLLEGRITPLTGSEEDHYIHSPRNQIWAAAALIKLKVAPVMTVNIPFGGDNHGDQSLIREALETTHSVDTLSMMWDEALDAFSLRDQVTFGTMNTFGRSLKSQGDGRSHNGAHHVMMLSGPHVAAGVVGGVEEGVRFAARGIHSETGEPGEGGAHIPAMLTLEAAGATLAAAAGLPHERICARIPDGRIVEAVLRS